MAALVVLGLVAIAMRRRKLHGITLPTAEYVAASPKNVTFDEQPFRRSVSIYLKTILSMHVCVS